MTLNSPRNISLAVPVGTLLSLFGLLVLLTRRFAPDWLHWLPGIEPLSPLTALYLMLSGLALLGPLLPDRIGTARVQMAIGTVLCLMTLTSMSNLFTPEGPFVVATSPAHNACLAFFFGGLLLVLSHLAATAYTISFLFLLFILICTIALLGLVGLTIGFDPLFGWSEHVHMTGYTVIGLLLFAMAQLQIVWRRVRLLPRLDPVRGISGVTAILVVFIAFAGGIVIYSIAGANIYQEARNELYQLLHERAERLFTAKEIVKLRQQLLAEQLLSKSSEGERRTLILDANPNVYVEITDAVSGRFQRYGTLPALVKEEIHQTSPAFTLSHDSEGKYFLRHRTEQGNKRIQIDSPLLLSQIVEDKLASTIDYDFALCGSHVEDNPGCLKFLSHMSATRQFQHEYWHPHTATEPPHNHSGLLHDFSTDELLQASIFIPELALSLLVKRDLSNIFGPLYDKMLYAMPLVLLLAISGVGFVTWRITPLLRTIQESEQRFRLLAENANDMISLHDMEGNYLYASPASLRLLGYTANDMVGRNAYEFIHPDDLSMVRESHDTVISSDEVPRVTFRIRRKNGNYIWFETTSSRVSPGTYSEAEIISVSRDITAKQSALERLRESELRYRTLIEQASDAIFLHDNNRRFLEVNKAACELLGYRQQELVGMHPEDFLLEEDHNDARIKYEARHDNTIVSRRLLRRKDGKLVTVDIHATGIEGGGIISIVRDISEQVRIENELRESRESWRSLVETAPDTIMTVDRKGKLLSINRGPAGLDHEAIVGLSVLDFVAPDHQSRVLNAIERVYAGEEHVDYEIEANGNHGKTVWWSSRCGPVYHGKKIVSAIIITRDISERYMMEQALRYSERHNRTVIDVLAEGIVVHNRNGKIVSSNRAAQQILGRSGEAIHGMSARDPEWNMIHEDGSLFPGGELPGMRALFTGQSQRETIVGVLKPDGQRVWISVNSEPVWDDKHREVVSAVSSFSDITDKRQVAMDLRESRERLRALTTHLQEIREEEKAAVAREVHDELGSVMTALKLSLSWLRSRMGDNGPVIEEKLDSMSVLLDHAVTTVRRLVTQLRPTILDDLGLWAALEWQLREFSQYTHIQVSDNLNEQTLEVSHGKALTIYRVLQEALTNIAKHANASKIRLDCWNRAGILHIMLEDNGVGVSETTTLSPTSHGLRGMYERIGSVGGKLQILSDPGEGTVITIEVPHD